jgi:hypothetical protein
MKQIITKSIILALISSVINSSPAFAAYIDPNTGGMLFQLLAVLFGLFSAIMLFFSAQIRMAFARGKRLMRSLFRR